jgi:hypothetical protein
MAPPTLEFEVMSSDDQYRCNDWANSYRHSCLLVDELKIKKNIKDKSERHKRVWKTINIYEATCMCGK